MHAALTEKITHQFDTAGMRDDHSIFLAQAQHVQAPARKLVDNCVVLVMAFLIFAEDLKHLPRTLTINGWQKLPPDVVFYLGQ